MTTLVTGATGTIGRQVVEQLVLKRLTALLGRPPRSYHDFASEIAATG